MPTPAGVSSTVAPAGPSNGGVNGGDYDFF